MCATNSGTNIDAFQSAPLTEARGDEADTGTDATRYMFQSAPLTEARGDFIFKREGDRRMSFNPLPSPKQGETPVGEPLNFVRYSVSIRSPHRSKGRHRAVLWRYASAKFQSAPLTEARGDHGQDHYR